MDSMDKAGDNVSDCQHDLSDWEDTMDQLYTWLYLIILVPGLLGNSLALWVLCRFIRKRTKAVIFMINLALADLLHMLSLPFRIYYYFTHSWPFGHAVCLLCFYLKYLNMYAGIAFLACISVQRCVFLMRPFCAKSWKRRYDVRISTIVWLVVGLCCLPFIVMRIGNKASGASTVGTSLHHIHDHAHPANGSTCFKDLPIRSLDLRVAVPMMAMGELLGFVLPLSVILACTCLIHRSLYKLQRRAGYDAANRRKFESVNSCSGLGSGSSMITSYSDADSRRALRMVRVCTGVFLVCFGPYHVSFLFYMLVSQGLIVRCEAVLAVLQFHPVTLCVASLSCCLNPLVYYFLTAEFREQLARHGSFVLRGRLMSLESTSSGARD